MGVSTAKLSSWLPGQREKKTSSDETPDLHLWGHCHYHVLPNVLHAIITYTEYCCRGLLVLMKSGYPHLMALAGFHSIVEASAEGTGG